MNESQIDNLVEELRERQHISQCEESGTIESYIKEAEFDINKTVGSTIDYSTDLKAKSLLFNYVLYARYNRLAEFKQLYEGEYADLQAEYYKPSDV